MSSNRLHYSVEVKPFNKTVTVPPSKSYANRALVLGATTGEGFTIDNLPRSTDVISLISLLAKIGLRFEEKEDRIKFLNRFPDCEEDGGTLELLGGDGGTTNRFILPLLSRGKRCYQIKLTERMSERPMYPVIDFLKRSGVEVSKDKNVIQIKGPLKLSGNVEVDGAISSQFASGILLAFSDLDVSVTARDLRGSKRYFEMTKDLVKRCRNGEKNFWIPPDWSSASYPMALAAVTGSTRIVKIGQPDNNQADSDFAHILKKIGANVTYDGEDLMVSKKEIHPINLDCYDFPDLVPALCFVLSYADGDSVLTGLESLRHKESDRIKEILKIFDLFKVNSFFDGSLKIKGGGRSLASVTYDAPADHRMIMLSYLFMRASGGGTIINVEHIGKSFPGFFQMML